MSENFGWCARVLPESSFEGLSANEIDPVPRVYRTEIFIPPSKDDGTPRLLKHVSCASIAVP